MAYTTADIRNVALVGPGHAGKTQLAEALLYAGGALSNYGSVEQGNTVSDYTPGERQIGHSLYPSICHLDHSGIHINLIDTPGHRDFYGRTLSVLPAVETAVVVVSAENGIQEMTRRLMHAAQADGLCRMIVINKIDVENQDLAGLTEVLQEAFGSVCLPINLPAAHGDGVVDCFFQPAGADTAFSSVAVAHTQIIDQVVEVDEDLMELYLEQGEDLEPEQLHAPFEKALREGHLVPICFTSARSGVGVAELLDVFERLMPNPTEGNPPTFLKGEGAQAQEVVVEPDPELHVVAHVIKVDIDPFKGRLGVFRIHQGTLRPGMQLFVGDARKPIKVTQLLKVNGNTHTKIAVGLPGDICAMPRVDEVHYDAVLHDSHDEDHFHLIAMQLPLPMYGLAINSGSDSDAQKVSDGLHTLEAEDPSIEIDHVVSLNEIVLRGLGDLHLRTVLEEISERYELQIETSLPSIAYRETITKPARGHSRHKKQTGGAGQFGEVFLSIEPMPAGAGFEFINKVVGGAIPSQFISAVETGVRQGLRQGAITGHPMQDVKVKLNDGKHHSVDSKEVAFVHAGKKAFLDAVKQASPIVMEPIVEVSVTVPESCVGGVTGDLAAMRGSVRGTSVLGEHTVEVSGQAPLKDLQAYHSRLKSLTGGEGSFTMEFSHYAEVTPQMTQDLVSAYRGSREE